MDFNITEQKVELSFGKRQFFALMAIEIICWIVAISVMVWGFFQYRDAEQLRQENLLHQRQLELANDKLVDMEKRLERLDVLETEIRQMMQGAQSGTVPAGEGSTIAQKPVEAEELTPGGLLERLAAWESNADRRIISLSTMQFALRDGIDINTLSMLQTTKCDTCNDTPSIWPASGCITSAYGWRASPFGGGAGFHEGIDIANDYGTPITATAKGVVTRSEWVPGYGNLIEIRHAGDIVTRYGHNSLNLVNSGDEVFAGELVALMGSTGRSTGSHVHYEVRISGTPVDPMLFLPKNNTER